MEICANGHIEICHEQLRCPFCDLLEENSTKYLESLNTKENTIAKLQEQLNDYKI